MNNELTRVWKKAVVIQFGLLPERLPAQEGEYHESRQSGQTTSGQIFKPEIARIKNCYPSFVHEKPRNNFSFKKYIR